MKKLLGATVIIGAGLMALPGIASAAPLTGATSAESGLQQVDFKPFRHCHGPRWDRRCHGGGFFFRGRDRWRDHDGPRYRDRPYRHRDRDRDRYDD